MAEAILYGTAVRFLGDFSSIPFQEIASSWNVKKDLKKLEATLSTIKSVLVDAEQQQGKSNEVKDWLGKLKHSFYELDDMIDDFTTEALRKNLRRDNKNHTISKVSDKFLYSKYKFGFNFGMSHKITKIQDALDQISSDRTRFHFKENVQERAFETSERDQTHSFVCESKIFGRESDKKAILESVMDGGDQDNVSIIPIVGIGGLGKTTLAQLVYNDEMVEMHFELKIWVCVSDVFDVKLLVEKIIKSINNECGNLEMDQLQNRLRKCLDGKRYMLVLDDVWNENREKWIKLEELLMSGSKGSKILVTTRSENVASIMGTVSPYHLQCLLEEDSWSLFQQLAFKHEHLKENQSLVAIGKEILQKCGGVPLAIRTVGSLLSLKDTEIGWLIVKDGLWDFAQDQNYILPTLRVSYDHLPYHLRRCFAYCSLFQKDSFIVKRILIQLWMAQGLIHPSENGEDIGDQYFKDLLFRSFFQDVEKDDYGNVTRCKMHDLMHDLAQSVAGVEFSIMDSTSKNISQETYHVSFYYGLDSSWEVPTYFLKAKKVRTVLFCGRINHEALIANFLFVRVLDLQSFGIENVPSSVGNLKHLRYLDLSWNFHLKTLPNSICKLQNLQTLKLYNCLELRELPVDIRKLVSLRHLEIKGCRTLNHMPIGLGNLTSLQTLQLFVVGHHNSISKSISGINELNGLNQLRGTLAITFLDNVRSITSRSKEETKKANLKAKKDLKELSLKWVQNDDEDADVIAATMEDLYPHSNLEELNIKGYGGIKFPSWMTFNMESCLPRLVQIIIDTCKRCQYLPSFAQLPFLKVLELKALSSLEFIHNNSIVSSSSSSGGSREGLFFPSLVKLSLFQLPLLKEWPREVVEADSLLFFPCLASLHIHNCPTLISIPFNPYLKELRLTYIGEKLLQSITVMKTDSLLPIYTLSSIKTIAIGFCEDMVSLPSEGLNHLISLQELSITHCHKLVQLPEDLRGFTSLRFLHINVCNSLSSLSRGISRLTCLQKLIISNCVTFDWLDDDHSLKGLVSLRVLKFLVLPKMVCLPHGIQHLTTLQELHIISCCNLVTLPDWIGKLESLRKLWITGCHKLKSLPDSIRCLTRLEELLFPEPNIKL